MIEIREKINGNYLVEESTILRGIINGDIQLLKNTEFYLRGMVIGNITVPEDAILYLNGTVKGNVINNGGEIKIFGVIKGKLFDKAGKTIIDENAIIKDE